MNWPVSRVPQCACWMTCSASSGAEVCTFLFWMVHCGMPGRCAVRWVRLVYHYYCLTYLSKLLCGTYDVEICFMLYLYVYVFMLYLCHVTVLWNAYLFGPKWSIIYYYYLEFKSLKPRRNTRNFTDGIFKCVFLNGNVWVLLKIILKFVLKIRINIIPSLVLIMACRRPGDKPLPEPMMVSLPTHICVTGPQWVNVI